MWLSYGGCSRRRKGVPSWGTTAIALTRFGATHLATYLAQQAPDDLDMILARALFETLPSDQPEALALLSGKGSYVLNGFGGFHSHESTCAPKSWFRVASWDTPKQPYARQLASDQPRMPKGAYQERRLCRLSFQGTGRSLQVCVLPEDWRAWERYWRTWFLAGSSETTARWIRASSQFWCKNGCSSAGQRTLRGRRPPNKTTTKQLIIQCRQQRVHVL